MSDARVVSLAKRCVEALPAIGSDVDLAKCDSFVRVALSFVSSNDSKRLLFAFYGQEGAGEASAFEALVSGSGIASSSSSTSIDDVEDDDTSSSGVDSLVGERQYFVYRGCRFGISSGDRSLSILPKLCTCVYFLRTSSRPLNAQNLDSELLFGFVVDDPLNELQKRMNSVLVPALRNQSNWGHLTQDEGPSRMHEVHDFLLEVDRFNLSLSEASVAVSASVQLSGLHAKTIAGVDDILVASKNTSVVERFENLLDGWRKQLQAAFAEGTAVRAEPDDAGPRVELEYWKARMAKFNGIVEQLKSKVVKTVVAVLTQAKSRILPKWTELDKLLTEAANEARDNVKFLYTMQSFAEPLYGSDPDQVSSSLAALINAVRMIHSISRFYNTSERLTALFVKITNQMINCCRTYIRMDGEQLDIPLWEQVPEKLIAKFERSIRLFREYQGEYRRVKYELQLNPNGKQFDCSEAAIFGKFDSFCSRLTKLSDVFSSMKQFTGLRDSVIEGIDPLRKRFELVITDIRRRKYDFLDFRRSEFDEDYLEFNNKVIDLEDECAEFIQHSFTDTMRVESAINMWKLFKAAFDRERLNRVLDEKHLQIWHKYGTSVDDFKKTYEKFKAHPPFARNFPPVAGSIAWARQLLRKMEGPMKHFQRTPIVRLPESKRIIKEYNRVARTLVEFETVWFEGWCGAVEAARDGLSATLLIRHQSSGKFVVNFDAQIMQLVREIRLLSEMGLEVPSAAETVFLQKDKLKSYSGLLNFMISEYYRVVSLVKPVYSKLISPRSQLLDEIISPGLYSLTWSSLNIDVYINSCMKAISDLETVLASAKDILEWRLEAKNDQIRSMHFVDLTIGDAIPLNDFIDRQNTTAHSTALGIDLKSREMEVAASDLVRLLTSGYDEEILMDLRTDCSALISHFQKAVIDSVCSALCNSVYEMKKRISLVSSNLFSFFQSIIRAEVQLSVPEVIVDPTTEQIQKAVNEVARSILESTKAISYWGQPKHRATNSGEASSSSDAPLSRSSSLKSVDLSRSVYDELGRNRQIIKVFLQLTGSAGTLSKQITRFLEQFNRFRDLWMQNRKEVMANFESESNSPGLNDYELMIRKYFLLDSEVDKIPDFQSIGALMLNLEPLKLALRREIALWKTGFGKALNIRTKKSMDQHLAYVDETLNKLKLGKQISDLSDVNAVMTVLRILREKESEMEMHMIPIEEAYQVLMRYHVEVAPEELEEVESIRRKWELLVRESRSTMSRMQDIGPSFKSQLVGDVQVFVDDVKLFKQDYLQNGPNQPGIRPRVAVERLKNFDRMYQERDRKRKMYTMGQELFNLPTTDYPELDFLDEELSLLGKLYNLYTDVIKTISDYEEVDWSDINVPAMQDKLNSLQTQCRRLPKDLREWEAYHELKSTIDNFLETLPLLEGLARPQVTDRHWGRISDLAGVQLSPSLPDFKVRNITEAKLFRFTDDVEEIAVAAVREADIEEKITKIEDEWSIVCLVLDEYKPRKSNLLLRAADMSELLVNLEDTQMALGSLLSNKYNAPFRTQIQKWVQRLSLAQETLELWFRVQNLWMYLEAVFSGGDIARQLPQEAKRFGTIDKNWVRIMTSVEENPNVVKQACNPELQELLKALFESLEVCQKSLASYLEQKRMVFPRFYFVSDAQLLEILGQGSDPNNIQSHLLSIFSNVSTVQFDKVKRSLITGFLSAENEYIPALEPVPAEGNVEDWLIKLVRCMQESVKDICRDMAKKVGVVLDDATFDALKTFVETYPAQISLLGVQLLWTTDSELALEGSKVEKGIMQQKNQKFVNILRHMVDLTTHNLSKSERTKLETLITIHIHQVDIFQDLVKKRIRGATDFEWLKQTRFYWKFDEDRCLISVTDVDFEYCFEYLGCTERLVITPLTDRIYISCAQAMGMYYGGAPAGPAGTGKTETTKDMGRTCGKYFITINCSDQMDYKAMGKLFKGIAQSGCWCGFDEVNRVELAVLSVVAAQIQCLFSALKEKVASFQFTDGSVIPLDHGCSLFITMNPGYAGRTELPENMKALFRSIAVVVPDRQIIMRVRLAASGFQDNQRLAKKFFILYRLCEEQLSKQTHYDFGLRNILSVLRTAGATKRSNPDATEVMILMRVLRDMNVSKLVEEDEPLFGSLIEDLFPGIDVPREQHDALESSIDKFCKEGHLINHKGWRLKVIQMYEQWRVRHGLCLMGPSGAGKTKLLDVLAKSLSEIGTPISVKRMNPKAITATQMFGRLDAATNDWTDGVFSSLWRRGCANTQGHSWIILDGPVDAVWIENLNTVLDDTKTLTLANGDRIGMPATLKLLFEVGNLDNASPATVSRMGMVYMGKNALGWEPVVHAWAKKLCYIGGDTWTEKGRPDQDATRLCDLSLQHMGPMLQFVRETCSMKMDMSDVAMVETCLSLLIGLLPDRSERPEPFPDATINRLFTYTLIWSLGALLELKDRLRVHMFFRDTLKFDLPDADLDGGDTVYEYYIDIQSGTWHHWREQVVPWQYPKDADPPFASILIPTVDNVRTEALLRCINSQGLPVLLIGESGTAKTVTIQQYIKKQPRDLIKSKNVSLSSATTPYILQRNLESSVEKRLGSAFGPPMGTKMIMFIDDINMPEINTWGDQVTNELTRQLVEDSEIMNLDKPGERIQFQDVSVVAAMQHPGGGRNDIPSRLKRHFAVFNVTLPSQTSVEQIYGTIAEGHFCSERGFSREVVERVRALPRLTRILWEKTKAKMLPTPAKFHYIFNLRDLSRIFQGVLRGKPEIVRSTEILMSLWRHECQRVLPDKFVSYDDVTWFDDALRSVVAAEFGEAVAESTIAPVHFVNFLRDDDQYPDPGDGEIEYLYEPASGIPQLTDRLEYFLGFYNEKNKRSQMNLVLFEFAIMHLIRVSRIITTPGGNALLVGVGGSGKQSLTRLASSISDYDTFQISLSKNYSLNNFLDDLKVLFRNASTKKPQTFLFTDNEIKDESFLEYMNMILCSGEIPGLFPKDEMEQLMEEMRVIAKKKDRMFEDTPENLYNFFVKRVQSNLHVVLCFSPVGDKFRNRARKFPGLISGCTIDWFTPWPREALHATADRFLREFEISCDQKTKDSLIEYVCRTHETVNQMTQTYFEKFRRRTYVTPKSYLSFVDSYKKIYSEKLGEIRLLADRINGGLQKLQDAGKQVAEMKIKLIDKEKELQVAQVNAEKMLKEITASRAVAEKKKNEVEAVREELAAKAAEITAQKEEADAELGQALPVLEKAEAALSSITPKDIVNLKALSKPPQLIKRIFDCVLILRQYPLLPRQPDSNQPERPDLFEPTWDMAVRMMNEMGFLNALLQFPKEEINDETCELLQAYFAPDDFTYEMAKKASGNVAGMCTWCMAMVEYHEVAKFVEPKKIAVAEATAQLDKAMGELQAAQAELDEKQRELDVMQAEFDRAMTQKRALEDDAALTKRRLESAENLISGLEGERIRWTEQSREFDARIVRLTGDVAIASAFLSYCGPFNSEFRDLLIEKKWKAALEEAQIPFTRNMQLTRFLVDEPTIGEWNLEELPTDELSTQNGIIVTSAARYPLLIDPQGQGKNWLKKRGEKRGIVVTNLNHRMFRQHLEDSLQMGNPLLIEDVGNDLDPMLDPILEKQFIRAGSRGFKVKLGDKECDVVDGFQLYITTKIPNPAYTPETYAKVSIIDFTVTLKGLEDQLLGIVILKEKSELEEERTKLMEEITANKKKIARCENDLLERLASTTGSLVDDDGLIEMLANTKITAREAAEKLAIANKTEEQIGIAREEFRPVATRGSILYFVITELSLVNYMYSTSLSQFLYLFNQAMDESEPSEMNTQRIVNIIEYATFSIYKFIQRGLYESQKPMYRLLLALKIDLQAGRVLPQEFGYLLKGGGALDVNTIRKKPFKWIPDPAWLNLVALSDLPIFSPILDQISMNEHLWKSWWDSEQPESEPIPDGYEERLDTFKRLLLVRAFRDDRAMQCATKYIMESLGPAFVDTISPSFEGTLDETSWNVPVICLLSMGSDPTSNIVALAKSKKVELRMVSMGQGQEVIARSHMEAAISDGCWVLLQNCHLACKYLEELESQLMQLGEDPSSMNRDLRLWITTEPTANFPINLLQMGIKMTNEPPQGLRAGLTRSFDWIASEKIFELSEKPQWKPLLYTLCFLHSTVIERKRFGPLGWCVPYEFNQTDLAASEQFLNNHLDSLDAKQSISWTTVRYMICEVQYGGRITDDYDKRLLNTYGDLWFTTEIFSDRFEFFRRYSVPQYQHVGEFQHYIRDLPVIETPEVFGLHPNAELALNSKLASTILGTIMDIQPKDSGGSGGESRETSVLRTADDLLSRCPSEYKKVDVIRKLTNRGELSPFNIFLSQEIDRMQIVLSLIKRTLEDLKLAIAGTIIMSSELQEALNSLFDARVPPKWLQVSWDSPTLGFWFSDVQKRCEQFSDWLNMGAPSSFWLNGFFNPQGFLTAMKQETTRKNAASSWALDGVTLRTEVLKVGREKVNSNPDDGVYIHGLNLDGAAYNRNSGELEESIPKELFCELPVVHFTAVHNQSSATPAGYYQCPIYKLPRRTALTYVADVTLKTSKPPEHWILRGVAALCSRV